MPLILDYFASHPETEILYGDADHIDKAGNILEPYPTEPWNAARLLETCYICQPSVFFRRSLVDKIGLLNETLQYCMDYEYWLRAGKATELAYVPMKLAGSRLYPETKTLGSRGKVHAEILDMISRVTGEFSLHWAANLGRIVAEEQGIHRGGFWQNLRFAYVVGTTIRNESLRHGYAMSLSDWLHCARRGNRTLRQMLEGGRQ